jgi:hypothetical protein
MAGRYPYRVRFEDGSFGKFAPSELQDPPEQDA